MDCVFCKGIERGDPQFFAIGETSHFTALWDGYPVRPGHSLLIPKRHVARFSDLNEAEQKSIAASIVRLKAYILTADLKAACKLLRAQEHNPKSQPFIDQAEALLDSMGNRPPDAFNDGINDGPAADQTVPHLHWHVIPRWNGDDPDPRGGIRHMFQGLGNYREGIKHE